MLRLRCAAMAASIPLPAFSLLSFMRRLGLILAGVLTLASCDAPAPSADAPRELREPSTVAPAQPVAAEATKPNVASGGPSAQPAAVERAAEIDIAALNLPGEQLLADPSLAEWDTELLNTAAGTQLKQIEKLLAKPETIDTAHLAPLVTDDFTCTRLRSEALEAAFEDAALVVRRPASAQSLGGKLPGKGAAALVEALREFVSPLAGAKDVHTKVKIFHVSLDAGRAETELYFHLSGVTSHGVHEQNATWRCGWKIGSDRTPQLASIALTEYEEAAAKAATGTLFSDCTEAAFGANASYREQLVYGLDHWLDRIEYRYGLDAAGWEGIALGDVDGDGLDDLFVCQGGGLPNRLYRQNADGTATDTSAEAGVDLLDSTHAALFVDLDNDGDQDLAVAISLGILFYENDGAGHFTLRNFKLMPDGMPYSIAAADFDNDTDLDLYVCCYSPREASLTRRFLGRPIPYHDANNGSRNALLRNDRYWNFRNVTSQVGLDENNQRFSFSVAWEDFDNDGDQDLHVANDYGRDNLYRNDGGVFRDTAPEAGVDDVSAGMSSAWGDYNEDGLMDLYVSNMWSSAGNRIAFQDRFHQTADAETKALYQRHARGNALFMNRGDGTFEDVSVAAGVTMGRWAWCSRFVDINNDGRQEILVANGFLTQDEPDDL